MGINLSTVDRVIRVAVGAIAIALALLLVRGIGGVVLGLIGALVIFSGTIGFCHVYKVLNIRTNTKVRGEAKTTDEAP